MSGIFFCTIELCTIIPSAQHSFLVCRTIVDNSFSLHFEIRSLNPAHCFSFFRFPVCQHVKIYQFEIWRKKIGAEWLYISETREVQGHYIYLCTEGVRGCRARVSVQGKKVVGGQPCHDHPAPWEEVRASEVVEAIVLEGKNTREPPVAVIQRQKLQLEGEPELVLLPKDAAIKRRIRRARNKILPPLPQSLQDLGKVPARFEVDHFKNRWLLDDNGPAPTHVGRILVFSSFLRQLSQCSFIIMDGTFKVVPRLFLQLYTISGNVNGKWLPLVACLMEKKNEESYGFVLRTVKAKCSEIGFQFSPQFVATDFEKAAMNATKNVLPESKSVGCLFHWCQILFRRLQAEGLQMPFNAADGDIIRQGFRAICGLALVPLDEVSRCFEILREEVPDELQGILDHLESDYVLGRRIGRGRKPPKFPPSTWNCVERVQEGFPRTSNTIEGWHLRFRTLMRKVIICSLHFSVV